MTAMPALFGSTNATIAVFAITVIVATSMWLIREFQDAPLIGPEHPDYWTGREIRDGTRDAYLARRDNP